MPWFKVDDHFWSHPKTAGLSDGATALWLRAGSWSAGHLTDGRVPVGMLRMFRARRRSADELVAVGLWSLVRDTSVDPPSNAGDTFVFTSWHEYQPSKAQVETKREATRTRVNAWRERQSNGVTNESPPDDGNAPPDPTRPDPSQELPEGSSSVGAAKRPTTRGTRIPEPFILTAEMRNDMAAECPAIDLDHATRQFVDYWRAAGGRTATKKDWVAAWRFWIRRDAEKTTAGKRPAPTERAMQTAAAGRSVAGRTISTLEPKELAS